VPLDLFQRYVNLHYSVSLDLFGGETSTNVAGYFSAGLKGRWSEPGRTDDHHLRDALTDVDTVVDGRCVTRQVAALTGLNADLRNRYITDCENALERWNRILDEHGVEARLQLPHRGFNRRVGAFAGHRITPDGAVVSDAEWNAGAGAWLPTAADRELVSSLMHPVYEPGLMASWVAPPRTGINGQPLDYEYVHLA
jgi:benzoyl-CoA 2,3-dioxygenase component B